MKTNKKELTVFALCAYAIPFLMMPLLYICLHNGQDTSIFANAQMARLVRPTACPSSSLV